MNAGGVWADEVRAPRRGRAPGVAAPGQGRAHHRAVGQGAQRDRDGRPRPRRRPVDLRGAVGQAHLHRHHRRRLRRRHRRSAVHGRRRRVPLARGQPRCSSTPLTEDDVIATWAGLRPLLRTASDERTADLSRRHGIRVSGAGVVTITGGKLTTYRAMAEDTIDQVDQLLDGRHRKCRTKHLALTGAPPGTTSRPSGGTALDGAHLARRYGTEASAVQGLHRTRPRARRAAGAGAAVREGRGGVRGAGRDGRHPRRRARPPHPGPAARPRRHAGGRPSRWPGCSRPSSGWDDAAVAAAVVAVPRRARRRARRCQSRVAGRVTDRRSRSRSRPIRSTSRTSTARRITARRPCVEPDSAAPARR